jgi:predicted membrane-bound spermidine synthase
LAIAVPEHFLFTRQSMFFRTRLVALLLFGSGFCALLYQTAWLREFRLIFGASTAATAAVLGVFMLGIGFGGIILGRRSEATAKPLRFYAQLECFIAVSAALSPFLILAARHFYIALGGTESLGVLVGTIIRLLLAALILGTPTFLMGGTLPAAARAVVTKEDMQRRSVGLLYGANTLGAVLGAVTGTFYCFENFGNHATLWMATALNIVIAIFAFRLSRSLPDLGAEKDNRREQSEADGRMPASSIFVLTAAGLVGFAFFLMEMVWYRMLGPLLGGSTFSFGLILAVALLGIGLGGVTYALLNSKRSASLYMFALTCAAEALFIALPYALGDRIGIAAMLLRPLGTIGFYGHIIAWTALCALVVFPAAFIAGIQFPILISLLGKGRNQLGSQTGAAYAWNTIGALIGSLAGGFGFMPFFSAPGVWKIVTVLLAFVSTVSLCLPSTEPRRWRLATMTITTVALALMLLLTTGPTAFWRHSQIGAGRLLKLQASPNEMRDLINAAQREVIWEKDGVESSVALGGADGLAFVINGRVDGNAKHDAGTQIMSGLIGAVLHPNPVKAMVIGLGTGSTAGWLAAVPSIERVDAVELEPAVLHVADKCAAVNHGALLNPKLHVALGDGREVMLTAREKYDIVVSEPSNPYRAGVAGLFTREYYESINKRLASGGIFLQWVQTYEIDEWTIQTIYRTLGSVFENVESWETELGDLLLVSSHQPIRYNVEALRARLAQEPFRSALLAAWRADGLEGFVSHYVGNETLAQTLQSLFPGPLNTDDRTLIEFAVARRSGRTDGFQMANLRGMTRETRVDRPLVVEGEIDWARVEDIRLSIYPSLYRSENFRGTLTSEQQSRAAAFDHYMAGDLQGALTQWQAQTRQPETYLELMLMAESLAARGEAEAVSYIEKLSTIAPVEAEAIRSEFLWRSGRVTEATEALQRFFVALREDPWSPTDLVSRSISRAGEIAKAEQSKRAASLLYGILGTPFSVLINDGERLRMRLAIGILLDAGNPGEHALPALEPFEPHVMWQRQFLEARKTCYENVHSPLLRRATRDLEEFARHDDTSTANLSKVAEAIEALPARKR